MSEPAKDEDELVHRVADTLREYVPHINFHGEAIRAIAAIRAAGWVVVPAEPTYKMMKASQVAHSSYRYDLHGPASIYEVIYQAALAAAPGVKP
jgi:hypothetical protein